MSKAEKRREEVLAALRKAGKPSTASEIAEVAGAGQDGWWASQVLSDMAKRGLIVKAARVGPLTRWALPEWGSPPETTKRPRLATDLPKTAIDALRLIADGHDHPKLLATQVLRKLNGYL